MEHVPFPAAFYRNGESRLVLDDKDAEAAKAEGWQDRPPAPVPVMPPPDYPPPAPPQIDVEVDEPEEETPPHSRAKKKKAE